MPLQTLCASNQQKSLVHGTPLIIHKQEQNCTWDTSTVFRNLFVHAEYHRFSLTQTHTVHTLMRRKLINLDSATLFIFTCFFFHSCVCKCVKGTECWVCVCDVAYTPVWQVVTHQQPAPTQHFVNSIWGSVKSTTADSVYCSGGCLSSCAHVLHCQEESKNLNERVFSCQKEATAKKHRCRGL